MLRSYAMVSNCWKQELQFGRMAGSAIRKLIPTIIIAWISSFSFGYRSRLNVKSDNRLRFRRTFQATFLDISRNIYLVLDPINCKKNYGKYIHKNIPRISVSDRVINIDNTIIWQCLIHRNILMIFNVSIKLISLYWTYYSNRNIV